MVKIKKFSLSNLEEIMEIEKASFPNRDTYPNSLFEKYYKQYPEGFIVAENGGGVVGYTIGLPPKQSLWDAPGRAENDSAEIISLAVKPNWRRKGIGIKLTEFLINHFKEKGIKEISLNVRTKNQVGIAFYQKFDFKILKTIKNYYRNGDDAFLMKKEI